MTNKKLYVKYYLDANNFIIITCANQNEIESIDVVINFLWNHSSQGLCITYLHEDCFCIY